MCSLFLSPGGVERRSHVVADIIIVPQILACRQDRLFCTEFGSLVRSIVYQSFFNILLFGFGMRLIKINIQSWHSSNLCSNSLTSWISSNTAIILDSFNNMAFDGS